MFLDGFSKTLDLGRECPIGTRAVAALGSRSSLAHRNHRVQSTAKLYSGEATGLLVQLTSWQYPVVIDLASGELRYHNFSGGWGAQEQLDRFLQHYAVEKTKLEARKKGYQVSEQTLQDGGIRLQIIEGA